MLRLDCAKNDENVWVLNTVRKTFRKLYFWNTSYVWQITAASCRPTDGTEDSGEIILLFAGEDCEYVLRRGTFLFGKAHLTLIVLMWRIG